MAGSPEMTPDKNTANKNTAEKIAGLMGLNQIIGRERQHQETAKIPGDKNTRKTVRKQGPQETAWSE
jgi:hypothetical protein